MSTSNRLWCVFAVMVLIFAFAFPTIGSRVGIMTQEADGDPASTYTWSIKFPNGSYSIADNVGTLDCLFNESIIEPDLNADSTPDDGDILTYDSTGTNFEWITPNAGTNIANDLEEETHATEHAPNGADPINTWYWGGALTVGDATPPVTNGYLYDCTGGTAIAILDFYDSGDDDHSEFTDGDRIGVLMNDTDVTLDLDGSPAATYLEGNAGTDFVGHATQIQLVIFIYRNGYWYTPSLTMGQSNALTLSAKIGRNHNTFTGNDTMTDAEAYNHTHYVTSAAEIEVPAVGAYHEWSVKNHTADDVNIDPNLSEIIRLNGVALDAGDSIVGTDIGDGCSFEYYSAGVWAADCVGYEDAGD